MKQPSEITSHDVAEVVVHGAAFPALMEWAASRSLMLQPIPGSDESEQADLHSFVLVPSPELMRRTVDSELTPEQRAEYKAAWDAAEEV